MFLATVLLLASFQTTGAIRTPIGRTSDGRLIEASIAGSDAPNRPRVLLIGGLDGSAESATAVGREVSWYEGTKKRHQYSLTAIAMANPGKAKLVFPPLGEAYRDNAESHILWRWIGVFGPDLVIIAGPDPAGLAKLLPRENIAGVGTVPAWHVDSGSAILARLNVPKQHSAARMELNRRSARSPLEVARQMAAIYGHELNEVVYIPAVALISRLRLGERKEVEHIASPFLLGEKKSLEKPTSSHMSGHLLFADLADKTGDSRYVALVKAAADLGFDENGQMRESMPFHSQMSDSVFMACPILVRAWKLTGDTKYLDMLLRHFRFMKALDARPDGLWRHSPKDEAAWGRGNGFAILGMALALSDLPGSHPAFTEMRDAYRRLAGTLVRHQEASGMWRQVVDLPGSYGEFSATCIIGFSLLRGISRNWLDAKTYRPAVDRAWKAVKLRSGSRGELLDVCESTGAQSSVADYLRRRAIFGRDPRGGAMILMFATELAGR